MEWIVLGSGTLDLHPARGCSAHLLRAGGLTLLVDSGPGCLDRLARRGQDPLELAAVVHSHGHLDHLSDLFPLLFHRLGALRYGGRELPPLVLAGPPGHEERLRSAFDALYPKLHELPIRFVEAAWGEAHDLGEGLVCRPFPAEHSQHPRTLRFEHPTGRVAYSGDTAACEGLVEAARGVDWLVVECSSPDSVQRGQHLRPVEVAELIRRAQPAATVLVHLSPHWVEPDDAASAVLGHLDSAALVIAAHDGTSLRCEGARYSHSMVPGGLLEMS